MATKLTNIKKGELKIALVGNPNSGKSTIFNRLTGLNNKVGNFPGLTVEKLEGRYADRSNSFSARIVDLPGSYSLYPKTLDEEVTFRVLVDPENNEYPDLILLIADGSNIRRNLLFITQITDLSIPVIVVLNKMDIADDAGLSINYDELESCLGIPVVPVDARSGGGFENLKKAILTVPTKKADNYNPEERFVEKVNEIKLRHPGLRNFDAFLNYIYLGKETNLDAEELKSTQAKETIKRYSRVAKILKRVSSPKPASNRYKRITDRADKILLHPYYGYIFLVFILAIVFQSIFSLAAYPMEWIETGFAWLSSVTKQYITIPWLSDLLANGLISGFAGIAVFIPQIALLFTFIAVLEETGYMARVSFLMDNFLKRFGLNGLSAVALMSGFACAIPAIMSTRIIGSWRERLLTILVTPLMSCSARLPVYTLLIALVVPSTKILGFFNLQGLVMLFMYFLGFFSGVMVAMLFKIFIKEKQKSIFALELPLYQKPQGLNVLSTVVNKSSTFITEAGKVILIVSLVLWLLASFGPGDRFERIEDKYKVSELNKSDKQNLIAAEQLENSYAGIMGKWIEPAIRPLGYDWKIGIALITSFAAREVFVSTMSTIYNLGEGDHPENITNLKTKLSMDTHKDTGEPIYSLATVFSLLLFYAFAMQCMGTLAITFKETGGWKWTLIQLGYMTILAYGSAFLVYQLFS